MSYIVLYSHTVDAAGEKINIINSLLWVLWFICSMCLLFLTNTNTSLTYNRSKVKVCYNSSQETEREVKAWLRDTSARQLRTALHSVGTRLLQVNGNLSRWWVCVANMGGLFTKRIFQLHGLIKPFEYKTYCDPAKTNHQTDRGVNTGKAQNCRRPYSVMPTIVGANKLWFRFMVYD